MQFQHLDHGQQGEFFAVNASGQRIAEISYVWSGEHKIIANHTWVDDSLRGQGVARQLLDVSVHDKFHRTLILSGFCLLKIAKISLNSSFFPKPIKR